MNEALLQTKLTIPPQRLNLVPRQHLLERLNQGLLPGNKLTLVSAPAGFGKTTLVSAWAEQILQPAAWVSLDEGDNDLIRFLTYFIAALQIIDSHIGEGLLAGLPAPEAINMEAVLTILLNQTAETIEDAVIILDDFHVIDSKTVNQAVIMLLDYLPAQIRVILVTRADPRFPLPLMRARGELLEIRVRELRFSELETAEFLRRMLGFELPSIDVQSLQLRTEGWPAGIQLAALALQGHDNPSQAISVLSSGQQYIVDYLIEEVLDRQPEAIRLFLQQTSILERLNGSLCDAVTGQSTGEATLEQCERANLFLLPLAGEYRWYRYHALFAEVLSNRLHRFYAAQIPELHRRAAVWFRQRALYKQAGIFLLVNATGFAQSRQGAALAQNIFHLWSGLPAADVSLPPGPTFLYWAITLTPLLMIVGIVVIWRFWRSKGLRYAIPVAILYSGIPILWLSVVPGLVKSAVWSGLRVNISQFDLAANMLLGALLGIGRSIIYLLMSRKADRQAR